MSDPQSIWSMSVRLGDLSRRAPRDVALTPGSDARAALADHLGILGIRKLRMTGALVPEGRADWRFEGTIGATVVQACIVTLAPVSTRIDEPVLRRYSADAQLPDDPGETEMPEDDTLEPMPNVLDLGDVMAEALSLGLPLYPRASGVGSGDTVHTAPGIAAMRDADALPFAGLRAALKGYDDQTGDAVDNPDDSKTSDVAKRRDETP